MCHFITLIAPTNDLAAVAAVMGRHGRAARRVANLSIRKVLREGEHQYLTTPGHCDCGSVLSRSKDALEAAGRLAGEEAQMKRKGWSTAKIARAVADRRKTEAKPGPGGDVDSFDLWEAAMADLQKVLKLPYAGLLIRFYSGAIEDDQFEASRRDAVAGDLRAALSQMKEDEVTIFR